MSRLRWTLVALLAVSTVLFAAGVSAERSDSDTHAEPEAAAHVDEGSQESGGPEGTHEEAGESTASASEEQGSKSESGEEHAEDERLLGVDLESTPLIVLAVLAGIGLAVLAASQIGRLRGFLLGVTIIALAWAVLDIREVVHQIDESRTGIALVASAVAVLHLATALVSGRLARHASGMP
jgi:hypothetical protein